MKRTRRNKLDPMAAACGALGRGEWAAARDLFAAASERAGASDAAEAFEGLGLALWWLADGPAAIAAREQAYRLLTARGDALGAARVATWLVGDHIAAGARVRADEWRGTAHRLIADQPMALEHGWLAHRDGEIALGDGDCAAVRALGARVVEVGHVLAADDLETVGLALEGLALVGGGDVAAGIERLDRAADAAYSCEMCDNLALDATARHLIAASAALHDADQAAHPGLDKCVALWRAAAMMAPRRGAPRRA